MNTHIHLNQIRATAEMLGPMCDEDEQLFADMMEGETDIVRIVSRLHEQLARDGEMLIGIGERQQQIADRKTRIQARVEAFKRQIGVILRAGRLSKLELPEATYSVRDGKAKLVIIDPDAVPPEYQRTKAEPDKTAINEAFDDAASLPNWLMWTEAKDVVTARSK